MPSTNGSRASRNHSRGGSGVDGGGDPCGRPSLLLSPAYQNMQEGWGGRSPSHPSCQGEEEEKGDVVLCFGVKVPVEQAIQDGGMLLQRRHKGIGLCLGQVAVFDRLVHGALHSVQDDGVQLST